MTQTQLRAMRKIAEKNELYNTETKTLKIKSGKMAGTYRNISLASALEITSINLHSQLTH